MRKFKFILFLLLVLCSSTTIRAQFGDLRPKWNEANKAADQVMKTLEGKRRVLEAKSNNGNMNYNKNNQKFSNEIKKNSAIIAPEIERVRQNIVKLNQNLAPKLKDGSISTNTDKFEKLGVNHQYSTINKMIAKSNGSNTQQFKKSKPGIIAPFSHPSIDWKLIAQDDADPMMQKSFAANERIDYAYSIASKNIKMTQAEQQALTKIKNTQVIRANERRLNRLDMGSNILNDIINSYTHDERKIFEEASKNTFIKETNTDNSPLKKDEKKKEKVRSISQLLSALEAGDNLSPIESAIVNAWLQKETERLREETDNLIRQNNDR